jgi:hypothetical protein
MTTLRRYFEALPERALNRILVAQNWCSQETVSPTLDRCLVGHASDYAINGVWRDDGADAANRTLWVEIRDRTYPAIIFDRAARRFGLAHAVALVKARAAAQAERLRPTPQGTIPEAAAR